MPEVIMTVTPEQAKEWLENSKWQKVSEPLIEKFVGIMGRGGWVADSDDPLVRIEDGKIINGYHRLNSVVKVGKPIEMKVLME